MVIVYWFFLFTVRHTEIPEQDVYVCERVYDEANQRVCNLQSGLVKFTQVPEVTINEIYQFWKPFPLSKVSCLNSGSIVCYVQHVTSNSL